ncbi:aminotransferase class III-fold pyridoxal phosphate-dependent enzyme [Phenylobacterium montanum]|uniref:Aminotransferase class III-fold pyridoxal phosphate-dependent enzyme n=1 Tax=Phenylobacterium montanum TaxID=2823693 RepID=A0A975G334_9CAUL|nr:aminotransferase class III-fold pyridoxal phosphate-dependent enzyme [Caulobacter sp. S6]QUD90245.1 aminotransferase class III-fold pyridoxal phosphate-dependent enzyme [Caulobacter sp. S6]
MSDALHSQDWAWRARAKAVLPNGMYGHLSTQMLPEAYPQFFSRAEGAMIWDVDGVGYIDYMCAFGPNLFGYGDREIDDAYIAQLRVGDVMTGPSPHLVRLAEAMVDQVSHAEWALFCKNGTDATTAAVMAARAATGRRVILRAHGSYHGTSPWCTPVPAGTTEAERGHQIWFDYNDVESLRAAATEAGNDLAAIIGTPVNQHAFLKQQLPTADYARAARAICDASGAMLITDEVRSGFRVVADGIWDDLGAPPDLSAWGKAIANGHCISVVLGGARARYGIESVFVTGSFWFASAPMAAGLVVMERIKEGGYLKTITETGNRLRTGLDEVAARHGVGFEQSGPVTMPLMTFTDDPDFRAGFFWCAEMLKEGVYLHPWHNMFLNTAMTDEHIEITLKAADKAFAALNAARLTLGPNERLLAAAANR